MNSREKNNKMRRLAAASAIVLACALALCSCQGVERVGASAKKSYEAGDYNEALKEFSNAGENSPGDYRFSSGKGSSLYRMKNYAEAQAAFAESVAQAQDPLDKAQALYNGGNSLVQLGKYKEAIANYEQSLKLDPGDREAQENLEYAKRLLQQQNQQQSSQSSQSSTSQQRSSSSSSSSSSDSAGSSPSASSSSQSSERQNRNSSEQSSSSGGGSSEQSSQSAAAQSSQSSDQSQSAAPSSGSSGEKQDPRQKEIEALLGSLEEKRDNLEKYREEKAKQELRMGKRKWPEKDW